MRHFGAVILPVARVSSSTVETVVVLFGGRMVSFSRVEQPT